jgi:hypothetical protein
MSLSPRSFFNKDAYYHLGDYEAESNLRMMIIRAWYSALGLELMIIRDWFTTLKIVVIY